MFSGHTNDSCGSPDMEVETVDCTVNGDDDSICVYSHHCKCSAGYTCEDGQSMTWDECQPGVTCVEGNLLFLISGLSKCICSYPQSMLLVKYVANFGNSC